jgi:hypothetical protein
MDLKMLEKPAVFSPDRKFRYTLRRIWPAGIWPTEGGAFVAFIGLNPSTADEVKNDPTVTRCMKYAQKWGYGGMYMLNIFAYRSTDPRELYLQEDPIGGYNDSFILQAAQRSGLIVACWGNHGNLLSRGWNVIKLLQGAGLRVMRLGSLTIPGQPRHPLYLKGDLLPEPL